MAVYETTYRRWTGTPTPRWRRFLVVARYAWSEVFASRFITALFALALTPSLVALGILYLGANVDLLPVLGIDPGQLMSIDGTFFFVLMRVQGVLALLLAALVGPGLVSPDLAHSALPLYLCRPLTRAEYVAGKLTVVGTVLSLVTWVPTLVLVLLQTQLAGAGWLWEHRELPAAVLVGSVAWVLVLSLLSLALSAWVRWRTVAAGLLFGLFFVGRAVSLVVENLFDTRWGGLLHLGECIVAVWEHLLLGAVSDTRPPAWAAAGALTAVAAVSLLLLDRKLRAYRVVR